MLGRKRISELEAAFTEMEAAHNALLAEVEHVRKRAFLVDIIRDGRTNKFVFVRNGSIITIEAMGMLSDDVAGWKRDLI